MEALDPTQPFPSACPCCTQGFSLHMGYGWALSSSSDDIQHNTDQPGSHGICRPGAGWADCLKRKTWSSLVHDQPFNLLAGHSLTSDCIFDLVEFRISGWWSDQTWTSLVGSMSAFGQQTSSGCRRCDLKWYSWQSFVSAQVSFANLEKVEVLGLPGGLGELRVRGDKTVTRCWMCH